MATSELKTSELKTYEVFVLSTVALSLSVLLADWIQVMFYEGLGFRSKSAKDTFIVLGIPLVLFMFVTFMFSFTQVEGIITA